MTTTLARYWSPPESWRIEKPSDRPGAGEHELEALGANDVGHELVEAFPACAAGSTAWTTRSRPPPS